jgi:molybdenum-dependent DNA-binding transcriptional regulator ModE
MLYVARVTGKIGAVTGQIFVQTEKSRTNQRLFAAISETIPARRGHSLKRQGGALARMKLQQLKYLLAIADNGLNITAAAERLYTSQPGVSKQLKLLEEELGLQLFTRKGKSLGGITTAGEQVIERARLIMREVENIRTMCCRTSSGTSASDSRASA